MIQPTLFGDLSKPASAVLFSGLGGACEGILQATGASPLAAINHWPYALRLHALNHPQTWHYPEDVFNVPPALASRGRMLNLVWMSPDCFPAGTLVLTRRGYIPIETVSVGDDVLTHMGRWRPVTGTMTTTKPLLRIVGRGHPGLVVSKEHPILTRARDDKWDTKRRGYERRLAAQEWVTARDVKPGTYWASPALVPSLPIPDVPTCRRRSATITTDLIWLAGRYVADGWTRLTDTRAELVLTCGRHEVDALRARLSGAPRAGTRARTDELVWHERETRTAHQFSTNHRSLVIWLREQFGHRAEAKSFPTWAFGMAEELRRALLDGYMSGDGSVGKTAGNDTATAGTVSKSLAFSIKTLATTLGYSPSVYYRAKVPNIIEGRIVNARPSWMVRWRPIVSAKQIRAFREDRMDWGEIRSIQDAGEAVVYNLSVEEDESYVADSIVVHNCTDHSRAKGGVPKSTGRRSLADVIFVWLSAGIQPAVLMLENVPEFREWGPLDDEGHPIKSHRGELFREWVRRVEGFGYRVEWRILTACDYGAPTSRKRLYLIARRDGLPIVWPEPTHGPGRREPWRTAAECIDWSTPVRSVLWREKPLADATQRRIAAGLVKYVLKSEHPFIAPVHGHWQDRASAARGRNPCVAWLAKHYGGVVGQDLRRPMPTVTTVDHSALCVAGLSPAEDEGARRVAAFLIAYYGTSIGSDLRAPCPTVTTRDRFGLVTVEVEGNSYVVTDIGMRMLTPRELARAQGFADSYRLEGTVKDQVAAIGNSVCPPVARALVAANVGNGGWQ